MRIALLGTRGVPARYGGFETAAEEIGRRLVERGHDVVVYCRNPGQTQTEYLGMRLVNLPAVRHRAAETLSHTSLSVGHAIAREHPDVAIVFNAANAPFLPALRAARIPVAVHVDGLEWKRAKWGVRASGYYRWAEARSARWADAVIADAQGIADHLRDAHGIHARYIPYGAPIVAPGRHPAGRGRRRRAPVPPRRRPLRAREPCPGDRRGLRRVPGPDAADRGRRRPLRR